MYTGGVQEAPNLESFEGLSNFEINNHLDAKILVSDSGLDSTAHRDSGGNGLWWSFERW